MDHQQQPRDDDRPDRPDQYPADHTDGPAPVPPYGQPGQPGPHDDGQTPGWGAPASSRPGAYDQGQYPGYGPYGPPVNRSPYGQSPYGQSPYGYPQQEGYGIPSRRPGTIPLIPLALGDILGGSFATIRRNAAAVLGTALIVALVEIVITALATTWFFEATVELVMMAEAGLDPFAGDPAANPFIGRFFGSMAILVLAAVVTVFTGIIAHGVLSIVVVRAAAGLRTSLGQAWRLTGRQLWSLAGLGGLYLLAGLVSVLVFGGIVFGLAIGAASGNSTTAAVLGVVIVLVSIGFVVAWVWVYVKVLLAPTASAVEQFSPFGAVGRSWSLTRRHWWRTFGIVLLVSVIVGIIASVITTPLSMIGGLAAPFAEPGSLDQALGSARAWMIVTVVVSALVNAIARSYLSCVTALLYVDYRIRHESFEMDLAAAADQAGHGDDERFSTVRDVQAAAGTENLVPGRRRPSGTTGPA